VCPTARFTSGCPALSPITTPDPGILRRTGKNLSPSEDLDEILAWREERTVTHNLILYYDRMMLILDPTALARGLVRKKVDVVNRTGRAQAGQRDWRQGGTAVRPSGPADVEQPSRCG
jgi:hypothetical protein